MGNSTGWICATLLLCASAAAGGLKAMVKSHGDHSYIAAEAVPCGVKLESMLRDRGFEVIERTLPESKADLVVKINATCTRMWSRARSTSEPIRNPNSDCAVQAIVIAPGGQLKFLSASGTSNTGHTHAISSACNSLAEQLDQVLGVAPETRAAVVPTKAYRVVLTWQGELTPMPLLVAANFFSKAGYQAQVEQGGQARVAFRVRGPESNERLAHLLRVYLESKFSVTEARSEDGAIALELSSLPDPDRPSDEKTRQP